MTPPANASARPRRRGAALEAALLNAAWDELVETGFPKLTMESVAARAGTGIAVLYRRWANKDELVLAALTHYRASRPVDVPDTGTLRGDLFAALIGMGQERADYLIVAMTAGLSGLLASMGLTIGQVGDEILGRARLQFVRTIYQRAHDRGELDLARTPSALLALPFDLVRHDLLMNLKPVDNVRICAIVDELFLPLVRSYRAAT